MRHREWLRRQQFAEPATELAFCDLVAAVDGLAARKATLDERLARLATDARLWPTVSRLRCFRGIDTLTALCLHLELGGDWQRFRSPRFLFAWLGLTPTLDQSGQSKTQGAITKTGSVYARRLLVESAWHYSREPRIGIALRTRQARGARSRPADRLACAAASLPAPSRPARARQARQHRDSRRRARARRLPLGGSGCAMS